MELQFFNAPADATKDDLVFRTSKNQAANGSVNTRTEKSASLGAGFEEKRILFPNLVERLSNKRLVELYWVIAKKSPCALKNSQLQINHIKKHIFNNIFRLAFAAYVLDGGSMDSG